MLTGQTCPCVMSSSAFYLYNILRNITKVCCSCGLGHLESRPRTTSNVRYAAHGARQIARQSSAMQTHGGLPNSPSNEAPPWDMSPPSFLMVDFSTVLSFDRLPPMSFPLDS